MKKEAPFLFAEEGVLLFLLQVQTASKKVHWPVDIVRTFR
jgi:hypothetical protein